MQRRFALTEEKELLGYWGWLRRTAKLPFLFAQDWRGIGGLLGEALCELWTSLTQNLCRLFFLVTYPISIPLIALWCARREVYVQELRRKRKQEYIDSMTALSQKTPDIGKGWTDGPSL